MRKRLTRIIHNCLTLNIGLIYSHCYVVVIWNCYNKSKFSSLPKSIIGSYGELKDMEYARIIEVNTTP